MILHIVVTSDPPKVCFHFYDSSQPFKKKTCDYKIVAKKEPCTHAIIVKDMRAESKESSPSEIIILLAGSSSSRFVKFNYKPITSEFETPTVSQIRKKDTDRVDNVINCFQLANDQIILVSSR